MKASLAAAKTAASMESLTEQMARIEETQARIEAKLDAVLEALSGGKPVARPKLVKGAGDGDANGG